MKASALMKETPPSVEEWKALFEAATQFNAIRCWEWMHDSDLFGVQNPASGEIGYCCVMGNLGQLYALGVYLGSDGLESYFMLASGELAEGDPDLLHYQRCLMAAFEDRNALDRTDLKIIKDAGLKFRGRNNWPQFRSYRPGYFPWHLTADEARFLTIALQQAVEVALRFKQQRDLFPPAEDNIYFVRVPERSKAGLVWKDKLLKPAPLKEESIPLKAIDEVQLSRIKKTASVRQQIWETDFFIAPMPVREKEERPYFPYMLLWVDQHSYLILYHHMSSRKDYRSEFQSGLLSLVEMTGTLPIGLLVRKEEAFDLLEPITSKLGVKLVLVEELDALEQAREALFGFLGGR